MNRKQLTIEAELTLEELRFAEDLRGIVRSNLQKVYSAINFGQVNTNWNIGRRIVEEEQHGQTRAEYGKRVIAIASQALTEEFGKGYSQTNCKSYRKFYIEFQKFAIGQTLSAQSPKQIQQTVSAQFENELELLPWSHYERLMRVTDKTARIWYMHEAAKEMWSFRTLNRNINTQYYERMLLSQMSNEVKNEMIQNTVPYQRDKFEFIKNPTVLEFLGLPGNKGYTEQKIEQAIIDNMEHFLLEMGKGFALVAMQQLIRTLFHHL